MAGVPSGAPRSLPCPARTRLLKKHVSLQFIHGLYYVGSDVFLRRREWDEHAARRHALSILPQCLLRGGDFPELSPDCPGFLPAGGAKHPPASRSGHGDRHLDALDQNVRDHRGASTERGSQDPLRGAHFRGDRGPVPPRRRLLGGGDVHQRNAVERRRLPPPRIRPADTLSLRVDHQRGLWTGLPLIFSQRHLPPTRSQNRARDAGRHDLHGPPLGLESPLRHESDQREHRPWPVRYLRDLFFHVDRPRERTITRPRK